MTGCLVLVVDARRKRDPRPNTLNTVISYKYYVYILVPTAKREHERKFRHHLSTYRQGVVHFSFRDDILLAPVVFAIYNITTAEDTSIRCHEECRDWET